MNTLALLVTIVAIAIVISHPAMAADGAPDTETQMIATFADYAQKYDSAGNSIVQGRVPAALNKALCRIFQDPHVTEIEDVDLYEDGTGGLVIRLSDHITLTTYIYRTVRPYLAKTLETYNIGEKVTFSGKFYVSEMQKSINGSACLSIVRFTESGRVHDPVILFDFTSLAHFGTRPN